MTNRAVHFEELELHRVLGIGHREGFRLEDLSPGVNLIHGPNGSGKTTTARVIQELLWPGRTGIPRPTISGTLRDGDTLWRISLDAGHLEVSCDGRPASLPYFGPPESRHRYKLALDELIVSDLDGHAGFAKAIADATQGGFDLEGAAEALGFSERPPAPRKLQGALKQARDRERAARTRQRELEREENRLDDLREQRDRAKDALRKIDLLQKARSFLEVDERCREVNGKLEELPPIVSRLRGDERERLKEWDEERARLEGELASEKETIEGARREIEEAGLPAAGLETDVLRRARALARRLQEIEPQVDRERERLFKSEADADRARRSLGFEAGTEPPASIEEVERGKVREFARRADAVHARETLLDERRRSLERRDAGEIADYPADKLSVGVHALGQWLASPPASLGPPGRPRWVVLAAAALIALAGVRLAIVDHWLWSLSLAVVLLLVALDSWLGRRFRHGATTDRREVHRETYQATGLPAPQSWDVGGVSDLLLRLLAAAAARAREDDRLRQLDELDGEAERLAGAKWDLSRDREQLADRLGCSLQVADSWLPLFVENLRTWQAASSEVEGAERVLDGLERERKELLGEMCAILEPFGFPAVDTAGLATECIEELAERRIRHRDALRNEDAAKKSIEERIEPGLERLSRLRRDLFEEIGIDEGDERFIDDWLADREGYLELKGELSKAETLRSDRRRPLEGHEELLELDDAEIALRLENAESLAAERDELSGEIARIKDRIERARKGHELLDALEARKAVEEDLARARDQSGAAAAGAALASWVRRVAIDRARPEVFRRANELFVDFTHGMLQLDLEDRGSRPSFGARRGSDGSSPLDELSVGERVQLLMAVRMAFLEQDEPAKLPLLLDEALGTSDDGRAGKIIDTVIEIAREGRQVFYFTAQRDEVGKWVARLGGAGVPYRVVDLSDVRRLSAASFTPLRIVPVEAPAPPVPDGMTHEEYGRVLGVPGIDLEAENLDSLHLWHLVTDVQLLYHLLSQGIITWGQLRTLLESGGMGILDGRDGVAPRIRAAAKAVDAVCRAWRIGRGRRVDRAVLLETGCISNKFIGGIAELAKECDGDAKVLLEALSEGKVKRWRSERTEQLEDYFEENGYLVREERLSREDMRMRAAESVADHVGNGLVSMAYLEWLLAQVDGSDTRKAAADR